MNKTPNYALNQWEADDRVQRVDFNADNAKIDAALAKKCELVFGSYTGDGAATRTISLGVTPKAVFVIAQDGYTASSNMIFGGLALPGSPAKLAQGSGDLLAVSIVSSGFQVYFDSSSAYYRAFSNTKDKIYHYFAVV